MTAKSRGLSARARANRRNALKSTGPRTAAGKARVARNALIHGLSAVTIMQEPEAESGRLACLIAGPDAEPGRLALAREIAAADEAVRRVRKARNVLTRLDSEPGLTLDDHIARLRELNRLLDVFCRLADYKLMSKRVYKGRPLKIDNYPRFRRLLEKLEEIPFRLDALALQEASMAVGRFSMAQARLLDRYEADALRRRRRAIEAYDRLVPDAFGATKNQPDSRPDR